MAHAKPVPAASGWSIDSLIPKWFQKDETEYVDEVEVVTEEEQEQVPAADDADAGCRTNDTSRAASTMDSQRNGQEEGRAIGGERDGVGYSEGVAATDHLPAEHHHVQADAQIQDVSNAVASELKPSAQVTAATGHARRA